MQSLEKQRTAHVGDGSGSTALNGSGLESRESNELSQLRVALEIGQQIYDLIAELLPIPRSITGNGVRDSLAVIARHIPLTIHEVPSGTPVLDWTVPKEWNVREAYIANSRGDRVVDYANSPLHLVGYSVPVRGRFDLAELKKRIFTIPEHPDWIPFRYSYYDENWGFCMAHNEFEKLEDGEYDVVIDSTLEDGSLTYGEWYLPGSTTDEMLISVHLDHPAMCNDNLSGVATATFLAKLLGQLQSTRLSYRIIFVPTTIGSIAWLSRNKANLGRVKHGFVMTCVGDDGGFTWKETRRGNTEIDRAVKCALRESGEKYELWEFNPFGFDERQFCSPGFNLPIGCFFRTYSHHYPENHTSADNLTLMRPDKLAGTLKLLLDVVKILEGNRKFLNTSPEGEPRLGKRGIYRTVGGPIIQEHLIQLFWVLNYSDGEHSLLDIVEKSKYSFSDLRIAADILSEHGLLVACE
jgi:aminopeptidase-like protein